MRYYIDGKHIDIQTIVSDLNGTLSFFGKISDKDRQALQSFLSTHAFRFILLTSDKRKTARQLASSLSIEYHIAKTGDDKLRFLNNLNTPFIGIGNARNDISIFQKASLGIAILGQEGLHPHILQHVDILAPSFSDALTIIADPAAIESTLNR